MGAPIVILPGYLAGAQAYEPLRQGLISQGHPAVTVPLRWWDWLPTVGGRSMEPILRALDDTVKALAGTKQVNLVCHSAGGWIARIYLGEQPYRGRQWARHPQVQHLVTLGTPHVSQEPWTRSNLDFVNQNYPGAFHPEVNYICVAGKAVFGSGWDNWVACNSYRLTVGESTCWGDGITPVAAAHLAGATNLTLEGVYHSPRPGRLWYGSPETTPAWLDLLS